MLPMRITLAGWSTRLGDRALVRPRRRRAGPRPPSRPGPPPRPAGPPCVSRCVRLARLLLLAHAAHPRPPRRHKMRWTPAAGSRQAGGMPTTTATHRQPRPGRPRRRAAGCIAASDLATVGFVDFTRGRDRRRPAPRRPRDQRLVRRAGCARRLRLVAAHRSAPTRSSSTSTCTRRPTTVSVTRCWRTSSTGPASSPPRRATPSRGSACGIYRQDTRTRGLPAGRGLRQADHVHPDADRPRPVQPAGRGRASDVTVRRITEEADLRVAHEIEEESFLEHYGNVPISFESWLDRLLDRGEDLPARLPGRARRRRRSGC